MAKIIFFFVLQCFASTCVWGITVNIPASMYEVARGDNVTLPCNFQPKNPVNNLVIITWSVLGNTVDDAEVQILTYYSNPLSLDISPDYAGIATHDINVPSGKANLILTSVTLAQNRTFDCRVQIPQDNVGKTFDTTHLVVLVAPSIPICSIVGTAEYGQNITLTCFSKEGSPTPTYKWTSRDVSNQPRVLDPKTTDVGGVLSLYNISKDTSGYFYCTSSNKIRSANCNVTLTVMPPSIKMGSTAAIIGGVLAGLIALIVIIYCCCCRKKKDKEEEYEMGVPEEEEEEHLRNKESRENGEPRYKDQPEVHGEYDDHSVRAPAGPHSDYDDHHNDRYADHRSDYSDHRSDYSDRRERYEAEGHSRNDRRDDDRRDDRRRDDRHYDDDRRDRRYDEDRYDAPYDERGRPSVVPVNKPPRRDE